jgi:hypothetical protein
MTHDIGDDLVAISGTDRWLDEIASGDAAPNDALAVGLAHWLEDLAPTMAADPTRDAGRVASTRTLRNRRLVMGALVSATILAGAGTAAAASAPDSVLHRILFGGTPTSTSDSHPDPTSVTTSTVPSAPVRADGAGGVPGAAASPTSSFRVRPPAVARATTTVGQSAGPAAGNASTVADGSGSGNRTAADDATTTDDDATTAKATPQPRTSTTISESAGDTAEPVSTPPSASDAESVSTPNSTDPGPDATADTTAEN